MGLVSYLLNRFGAKRFEKDKIASKPETIIDSFLHEDQTFESDHEGTLTQLPSYDHWQKVKARITDDMSPEEYNAMLVEEYGSGTKRFQSLTEIISTAYVANVDSSDDRTSKD